MKKSIVRNTFTVFGAFLIIIAVAFVVMIVYLLIIRDLQRPSRVDVSPLAQLSSEQVERIEEVVSQLENLETIQFISSRDWTDREILTIPGSHISSDNTLVRSYNFSWRRETDSGPGERVGVWAFVFQPTPTMTSRTPSPRSNRRFVGIVNDNNTEAVLLYATNNAQYPTGVALLKSNIRIGNVIFELSEEQRWGNRHNNISTDFIAFLVELLEEPI